MKTFSKAAIAAALFAAMTVVAGCSSCGVSDCVAVYDAEPVVYAAPVAAPRAVVGSPAVLSGGDAYVTVD